jgi:hypothetical protein
MSLIRYLQSGSLLRPRYTPAQALFEIESELNRCPQQMLEPQLYCPLECSAELFQHHWEVDEHIRREHPEWMATVVEELGFSERRD